MGRRIANNPYHQAIYDANYTLRQFSEASGISLGTIKHWGRKAVHHPSPAVFKQFLDTLGLPPSDFKRPEFSKAGRPSEFVTGVRLGPDGKPVVKPQKPPSLPPASGPVWPRESRQKTT